MAGETELERLVVRLVGDAAEYQKMLRDAQASASKTAKEIEGFGRRMEVVSDKLRSIGKSMSLFITLPIVGLGVAAVRSAAQFEQASIAFETILGSSSAAKQRIEELAQFAAATPFELPEIIEASRTLEVFTKGALSTGKGLTMVGDIASGVNRPFSEVALWVGRMYDAMQSGRPFGEASARLQEMGALSGEARARLEALGKSGKDISEIWPEVAKEFARFSGGMEKQSQSISGRLSTLRDEFDELMRQFGNELAPAVKQLTEFFIGLTQQFKQLSPEARRIIVVTLGITAAIGPLSLGLGTVIKLLGGLRIAMMATGIGALIAGVALIVEKFIGWGNVIEFISEGLKGLALIAKATAKALEEVHIAGSPNEFKKRQMNISQDELNKRLGIGQPGVIAKGAQAFGQIAQPIASGIGGLLPRSPIQTDAGGFGANAMQLAVMNAMALKQQMREVAKETSKFNKELQLQADTFGMTSREVDIYKLKLSGATDEQLKAARALDKKLTALEKDKELTETGKKITEQFRTPLEQFNDRQKELQTLMDSGKISVDTFTRAMSDAEKQMNREYMAEFKVTGIDAVKAGSAEALARLEEYRAGLRKPLRPGAFMSQPSMMTPIQSVAATGNTAGGGRDNEKLERVASGIEKIVQLIEDFETATLTI